MWNYMASCYKSFIPRFSELNLLNNLTLRVRRKITNYIKIFEYTQKMNNIPSIYNETNIYIVFDYINLVKDFILKSAIIVRQGQ